MKVWFNSSQSLIFTTASYVIAWEIAKASKPFSEGEFVRTCITKAAELVCPESRQALANISLSRPTVTERVEELSSDLHSQLKEKIKSFIAFSIALDESSWRYLFAEWMLP